LFKPLNALIQGLILNILLALIFGFISTWFNLNHNINICRSI